MNYIISFLAVVFKHKDRPQGAAVFFWLDDGQCPFGNVIGVLFE